MFDEGGVPISGSNNIAVESNMDEFSIEYGTYHTPSGIDWAWFDITNGNIPSHSFNLYLNVDGNDSYEERSVTHKIVGKLKTGQKLYADLTITQYGCSTTLVPMEAPVE